MKNRLLLCALSAFSILACGKAPEEIPAKIPVASVSINQPSAEMLIGETVQLRATISPSDATDKTLSWASSKQSVATVSETGLVTAIAEGASTITASAGGRTGSCTVTVSKGVIAVSSVELNKTELSLVEGDSETLFASVKPDDATDKTVTWSTSNSAIAKVESGKVTAVKEGEATITAKAGNKAATCKVVVAKKVIAVESVELNKTSIELVEGESETLTATVKPDNATDKTVTWATSDASIATVENGKVTAVKEGEASVTAKAGGKEAKCVIVVKHDPLNDPIVFADEKVKAKLVAAFDKNGDSELSYNEASAVKSLSGVFGTDTGFSSFNEFQFFTGVNKIEAKLFTKWNLESIVLPPSIKTIGDCAFEECYLLKEITLPESVTSLGKFAFSQCSNLVSVNASIGLKTIGNFVFYKCEALESFSIPTSVTSIGSGAFQGCAKIVSIEIPNGVTTINVGTFYECTNLTTITIPESVTSIDAQAFLYTKIETITIPSGVTRLEQQTFFGCSSLTTIEIMGEIAYIGDSAFYGCTKLKSINLPETLGALGKGVFKSCTSLESLVIPSKLSSIPEQTFYECKKLSRITIPNNITSVGKQSFKSCVGLTEIFVESSTPPAGGEDMFYSTNSCPIYVPAESVESYKAAEYWSTYAKRIQATP